jgi:hypothetical protein
VGTKGPYNSLLLRHLAFSGVGCADFKIVVALGCRSLHHVDFSRGQFGASHVLLPRHLAFWSLSYTDFEIVFAIHSSTKNAGAGVAGGDGIVVQGAKLGKPATRGVKVEYGASVANVNL